MQRDKHIYLVRHGTTKASKTNRLPIDSDSLTFVGIIQMYVLAFQMRSILSKAKIISSTLTRATQTASILARVANNTYVCSDLCNERNMFDSETYESLTRMHSRWGKLLQHIASFEEDIVVIVTHAAFIKVLFNLADSMDEAFEFEKFNKMYGLAPGTRCHFVYSHDRKMPPRLIAVQPPLFLK